MNTQHTPGPWNAINAMVRDGTGQIRIADCEVSYQLPVLTMDANARLVAAAPDMLAALQAAIDCGMVPISSALEGGAVKYSAHVRVADQIRAAIAKAIGGEA